MVMWKDQTTAGGVHPAKVVLGCVRQQEGTGVNQEAAFLEAPALCSCQSPSVVEV